jgi:hypothetical protein
VEGGPWDPEPLQALLALLQRLPRLQLLELWGTSHHQAKVVQDGWLQARQALQQQPLEQQQGRQHSPAGAMPGAAVTLTGEDEHWQLSVLPSSARPPSDAQLPLLVACKLPVRPEPPAEPEATELAFGDMEDGGEQGDERQAAAAGDTAARQRPAQGQARHRQRARDSMYPHAAPAPVLEQRKHAAPAVRLLGPAGPQSVSDVQVPQEGRGAPAGGRGDLQHARVPRRPRALGTGLAAAAAAAAGELVYAQGWAAALQAARPCGRSSGRR